MKRKILLTLASSFVLAACGNGDNEENISAQTDETSETESQANQKADSVNFDGQTLETNNVKIEITDVKFIPAGETRNNYGEDPVLAFWYDITNKSDKEIDPMRGWYDTFSVVQDNDPNLINELTIYPWNPDKQFDNTQRQIIKQGGTVSNAIGYILTDSETPVTLTATNGPLGEEIGSHDFEVNK